MYFCRKSLRLYLAFGVRFTVGESIFIVTTASRPDLGPSNVRPARNASGALPVAVKASEASLFCR